MAKTMEPSQVVGVDHAIKEARRQVEANARARADLRAQVVDGLVRAGCGDPAKLAKFSRAEIDMIEADVATALRIAAAQRKAARMPELIAEARRLGEVFSAVDAERESWLKAWELRVGKAQADQVKAGEAVKDATHAFDEVLASATEELRAPWHSYAAEVSKAEARILELRRALVAAADPIQKQVARERERITYSGANLVEQRKMLEDVARLEKSTPTAEGKRAQAALDAAIKALEAMPEQREVLRRQLLGVDEVEYQRKLLGLA